MGTEAHPTGPEAQAAASATDGTAAGSPAGEPAPKAAPAAGRDDSAATTRDDAGGTTRDDADGTAAQEPPRTSRRFPRLTRTTARPEGGGRAAPGDYPAPARQWPLLAVVGGTGLGLLVVAAGAARVGTLFVGLALIGGAVLRWWRPNVGMLAVRSRFTDIVTYGVLGTVILLLSLMMQPAPWLELPWLTDLVHLTVR